MANSKRTATTSRNRNASVNSRGMYVDGNTARRLQETSYRRTSSQRRRSTTTEMRKRKESVSGTHTNPEKNKSQLNRQTIRNREKAMAMNRGFVLFLALISVAFLFCCVRYLKLKSEINRTMKEVALLELEVTKMKEENDASYSQITSRIDLNQLKKVAIGRLGMKYPSDDQKMTYQKANNSYVRQYQDVPDNK